MSKGRKEASYPACPFSVQYMFRIVNNTYLPKCRSASEKRFAVKFNIRKHSKWTGWKNRDGIKILQRFDAADLFVWTDICCSWDLKWLRRTVDVIVRDLWVAVACDEFNAKRIKVLYNFRSSGKPQRKHLATKRVFDLI